MEDSLPRPTSGTGRFVRRDRRVKARVKVEAGARIELRGSVYFQSDLGEIGHTSISIGKNASLRILGDFQIGPNVVIIVSDGAELVLGGKRDTSASGVTSSAKIMVRERVEIGADAIIAWDVFITDSDWHTIHGRPHTIPVTIGDHVWIAHGASVLKGSRIGSDSVVAAHAVCSMKQYPESALLAGVPARVLQEKVRWSRELI